MKVKVVQYYIGSDPDYLQMAEVSKEMNAKYSQIHGYDYQMVLISEEQAKEQNITDCPLYKVKFLYDQLKNFDYDYLMFIDTDAAVNKPTIKVEDLVDDTHELFFSRGNVRYDIINHMQHVYEKLGEKLRDPNLVNVKLEDINDYMHDAREHLFLFDNDNQFNEGLIIVKNTKNTQQYFQDCVKYSQITTNFINVKFRAGWNDGYVMRFTLQLQKYNHLYTYMYPQSQSTIASTFEFKYDVDKTFILHNYGRFLTLQQKAQYMRDLKNNKWWKRVFLGKKKYKVVSYVSTDDQQFMKLSNLSKELNEKYCQLNNYEYYFQNVSKEKVEAEYGETSVTNICAYKIKFVYQQLLKQDCDYLVVLDADATVSNPNIKIEDLIDNTHQLFLSRQNVKYETLDAMAKVHNYLVSLFNDKGVVDKPVTSYYNEEIWKKGIDFLHSAKYFHNEGFYIIKNDERMREFYKEANQHLCLFLDNNTIPTPEEKVLIALLNRKKWKDISTFMYDQSQASMINSFEFKYDVDKTFLLHNYALYTKQQRIKYIEELKKNKWWKNHFEQQNKEIEGENK